MGFEEGRGFHKMLKVKSKIFLLFLLKNSGIFLRLKAKISFLLLLLPFN